ncbi:MAG: hypothetical protein ACLQQ0_10915, partial [Limisphaerales bacterium]
MNPESQGHPAQAAFDEGVALVNKGHQDQGEARLKEAARLGHPIAARTIVEIELARKVVGLAQAGLRSLALACLNDTQRLAPPPSSQAVAQLRKLVEQFQEGQFVRPNDKNGWNELGATMMEAGKLKEGIASFQKAIDLDAN